MVYKIVVLSANTESAERVLNRLAGEGWRVIGVMNDGRVIMAREVNKFGDVIS